MWQPISNIFKQVFPASPPSSPPLDTLPDEVFLNIFRHLGIHDLASVSLVNRRWHKISMDTTLLKADLSKYLENHEWHEESPCHAQAFLLLRSIKSTIQTLHYVGQIEDFYFGNAVNIVCCGNQLVSFRKDTIQVWKIDSQSGKIHCLREHEFLEFHLAAAMDKNEENEPLESSSIVSIDSVSFSNEIIHFLSGDQIFAWDHNNDKLSLWKKLKSPALHISCAGNLMLIQYCDPNKTYLSTGEVEIWQNDAKQLLHNFKIDTESLAWVYKKKIIYFKQQFKYEATQNITILDLDNRQEEKIFEISANKGNYANHIQIVNGVLFVWHVENGFFKQSLIKRYDIEEKKWLPPLKCEEKFICAIAGLIISDPQPFAGYTHNCNVWENRDFKINQETHISN